MALYLNTDLQLIVEQPLASVPLASLTIQRSDAAKIVVKVVSNGSVIDPGASFELNMIVKQIGMFDAVALVNVPPIEWVKTGTGTSTSFTSRVDFTTSALNTLLGVDSSEINDEGEINLVMQFFWGGDDPGIARAIQIELDNSLYRPADALIENGGSATPDTITKRRQERHDTATGWSATNPILALAEFGIVTDVVPETFKIGDGVTSWNSLGFSGGSGGGGSTTFAALTDKTTADLPTINIPLEDALAAKATVIALADEAAARADADTALAYTLADKLDTTAQAADVNPEGTAIAAALADEAIARADADTALAAAIAALAGAPPARTFYLDSNGAAMATAGLAAFTTAQAAVDAVLAAYDATAALAVDLRIGTGTFFGAAIARDWPAGITLSGPGNLGGLTLTGANGVAATPDSDGVPATLVLDFTSWDGTAITFILIQDVEMVGLDLNVDAGTAGQPSTINVTQNSGAWTPSTAGNVVTYTRGSSGPISPAALLYNSALHGLNAVFTDGTPDVVGADATPGQSLAGALMGDGTVNLGAVLVTAGNGGAAAAGHAQGNGGDATLTVTHVRAGAVTAAHGTGLTDGVATVTPVQLVADSITADTITTPVQCIIGGRPSAPLMTDSADGNQYRLTLNGGISGWELSP